MSDPGSADRGRAVQRVGQMIALAGVAALLALLVWKVVAGDGGGAADKLAKGQLVTAPPFTLDRLDAAGEGKKLSISELDGKPVVVNFWASWCVPCKEEAPFLQKVYEQNRSKGLVVLGIDAQDFRKDARRFMAKHGVTYPVVYDGKGSTLGKWGVTGFPETFFIDRKGNLVGQRIAGGVDIERNREEFDQALAQILATD